MTPPPDNETFNPYILRAVSELAQTYAHKGYGPAAYTHPLHYGPVIIPPSNPPRTMCVAAVAEVIITALDDYMKDHPAEAAKILKYLPARGWSHMGLADIRSHIWVDHRLQSAGTADALSTFGIGHHVPFAQLRPGSFIGINRYSGYGHAVVFLAFIDDKGNDLPPNSKGIKGFRYFSSQGKPSSPTSGMGYRYAFFGDPKHSGNCPTLPAGRERDCGVIESASQGVLNTGYMSLPRDWDQAYRDRALDQLAHNLYKQDFNHIVSTYQGLHYHSEKEFKAKIMTADVFTLNPKLKNQDIPN